MLAIWKRELQAYYLSPLGYVFMGFFLMVSGLFFVSSNILAMSSSISSMFSNLTFIFMLLVPILTMRLMSEERKNKTDQLLLTSPLPITSIVLGKYLAACTVFLLTLLCTLPYLVILSTYGSPYMMEAFLSYIGYYLLGCAIIAIGVFMSAISENQLSAAVSTFAVVLVLWMMDSVSQSIGSIPGLSLVQEFLGWTSLYRRFSVFAEGIFSFVSVFYYLSFSAVFVFLTVRLVEKRRWSEG